MKIIKNVDLKKYKILPIRRLRPYFFNLKISLSITFVFLSLSNCASHVAYRSKAHVPQVVHIAESQLEIISVGSEKRTEEEYPTRFPFAVYAGKDIIKGKSILKYILIAPSSVQTNEFKNTDFEHAAFISIKDAKILQNGLARMIKFTNEAPNKGKFLYFTSSSGGLSVTVSKIETNLLGRLSFIKLSEKITSKKNNNNTGKNAVKTTATLINNKSSDAEKAMAAANLVGSLFGSSEDKKDSFSGSYELSSAKIKLLHDLIQKAIVTTKKL